MTMCFRPTPLPHVAITEDALPHTVTFFDALTPLAVVDLAVGPVVDSLSVSLALDKVSFVAVAVAVPFESLALAQVVHPLAFINPIFPIDHDAVALPLALFIDLPKVHAVLVLLDCEEFALLHLVEVKHV